MTTRGWLFAVLVVTSGGFAPWTRTPLAAAAAAPKSPIEQVTSVDAPPDVSGFVRQLEAVVKAGDQDAFLALVGPSADRELARAFIEAELRPGASRVVIQERDRGRVTRRGAATTVQRLILDVFVEEGARARVSTWQLDVEAREARWTVERQDRLSHVDRLFRLSVNPHKQFDARNFSVSAEDFDLTLAEGSVFMVETDEGPTGLVLIGRGEMNFHPSSETEQGQVKIFAGDASCVAKFDAALVRFGTASLHADLTQLTERPVEAGLLRRAERVFREEAAKAYALDLGDLSREQWSLVPASGDFLAEVRTKRFGTLTYTRAESEAEDISFFTRGKKRNIAVYASKHKLEQRGRFYNEDELAAYDVTHYDVDLVMHPDRLWLEGETTMRLRVKQQGTNQLTIRLADSLAVRSITSDRFGRLFSLRVKEQNAVLVSLPSFAMADTDLALTIAYAGRLEPQPADREASQVQADEGPLRYQTPAPDVSVPHGEPSYLYSSRSYWYPQAPISDYATARIHITVPAPYVCLASGQPSDGAPRLVTAVGAQPGRLFRFKAERPLRYLSFLVSRFRRTASTTLTFNTKPLGPTTNGPLAPYRELAMSVEANPRQTSRARDLLARASSIARFYESMVGDIPYASFALALTEHTTPGGHSPGHFAALYQTLPGTPFTWQHDPASFEGYPEFFLAHELAHQWWGQAVGWRNYHEQWLSEGFAQYFAALYAQHERGDETFAAVLRHMRRSSLDASDQGPVYLGYRLGHIKNDSRVFRALVYNKGAVVLHMLRRLVGDEVFFRAIRRFYAEWRYRKAGTDDLRLAVEAEAGRSLERFFDQWIYRSAVPRLRYSSALERGDSERALTLRVEQTGEAFDVPLTFTVDYADRPPDTIVVPIADHVVDVRVPLTGAPRGIAVNKDDGALAEYTRLP